MRTPRQIADPRFVAREHLLGVAADVEKIGCKVNIYRDKFTFTLPEAAKRGKKNETK